MKQQTKLKQTEIGKIPEEWEIKKIGDVAEITMGQSPPGKSYNQRKEGIKFLQGVRTFGEKYPSFDTYTTQITKKAKAGSVLLSVRAPVGEVNITKEDLCIGRGLAALNMNNENNEFLYYLLKRFNSLILGRETGSVFGSINSEQIKDLELPFPKDSEQKSITKILLDLDAKIEINNKINKVLEAIGQVLFKKWFVDERKGEWKERKLGDYVESISGCSYTSKGLNSSENALVTLKSVGVNGFKQDGFKEYTGEYNENHLVQEGDIVVAHTDLTQDRIILGKPVIVRDFGKYKKMIASMDLSIVKPVKLINKPYLFYLLNSISFHGHAQGYSNGTTVIHLSRKAIPEFSFIIPDKEILEKFKIIADNLFNQIRINDLQNQKLSQIRDALLPKLMNGEVSVK